MHFPPEKNSVELIFPYVLHFKRLKKFRIMYTKCNNSHRRLHSFEISLGATLPAQIVEDWDSGQVETKTYAPYISSKYPNELDFMVSSVFWTL